MILYFLFPLYIIYTDIKEVKNMNYYDDNRRWICINGYNGYEYSNDGLLRSMKNFKVNPMGKLLKKYKNKKGDVYFETATGWHQVRRDVPPIWQSSLPKP